MAAAPHHSEVPWLAGAAAAVLCVATVKAAVAASMWVAASRWIPVGYLVAFFALLLALMRCRRSLTPFARTALMVGLIATGVPGTFGLNREFQLQIANTEDRWRLEAFYNQFGSRTTDYFLAALLGAVAIATLFAVVTSMRAAPANSANLDQP